MRTKYNKGGNRKNHDSLSHLMVCIIQRFSVKEALILGDERSIAFPKPRSESRAPRHLRRNSVKAEANGNEQSKSREPQIERGGKEQQLTPHSASWCPQYAAGSNIVGLPSADPMLPDHRSPCSRLGLISLSPVRSSKSRCNLGAMSSSHNFEQYESPARFS
jgi:hypothetical protein